MSNKMGAAVVKFGDFELSIIKECTFKLDGGAMFGVVPKPLWNKVSPSDELNRVPLHCNLLLIETGDQACFGRNRHGR